MAERYHGWTEIAVLVVVVALSQQKRALSLSSGTVNWSCNCCDTSPPPHTHTRPTSPQSHSSPRSCGAYTPCSTCIIEINLSQQNWGGGRPRSNGSQCDRDRGGGPAELERPGSQQGCENDFLATVGKKLEGFFFCSNPVKGTVHHTENYHCD